MLRSEAIRETLSTKKEILTWRNKVSELHVTPRVAIYARVSSMKQANEDTIQVQLSTCDKLFKKHFSELGPMCLVGNFQDEAYNMEAYEEGRAFWKLMELVKQGKVNRIIVGNENRIFRGASAKLRGMINDFLREGRVTLITPEGENHFKPTQTTDRIKTAVTQELGTINKIEMVRTLQTARRMRLVEDKQFRPAVHPYGYRIEVIREGSKRKVVKYHIHEEEAGIVRDIYNLYVGNSTSIVPTPISKKRMGAKAIAAYLNKMGFNKDSYLQSLMPSQRNHLHRDFTGIGITHILNNPAYAGKAAVYFQETNVNAVYEGDAVLQTIDVPAVVDNKIFKQAEKIRSSRQAEVTSRFDHSAQAENWLHAILKCPTCGWTMRGFTSSKKERYYGCPRKRLDNKIHRTFKASDIESILEKRLIQVFHKNFSLDKFIAEFSLIAKKDRKAVALEQQTAAMQKQVDNLQNKMSRLVDGYTDGIIPKEKYLESKKQIEAQIFALRKDLQKLQPAKKTDTPSSDINLDHLQQMLNKLTAGSAKYSAQFLRLIVLAALKNIEVSFHEKLDLTKIPAEKIKEHYLAGRITPDELRKTGWSWRKIYKELGHSGRRTALDYNVKITWITGKEEIITAR